MRPPKALADSPLWQFSVTRYARDGAKPAALALQEAGLDVPLALWLCWAVSEGRDPLPHLETARDLAARWNRDVVHRLRAARDVLKHPPGFADPQQAGVLRRQILDAELDAEAMLLGALEALPLARTGGAPDVRSAARGVLEAYARNAGVTAPVRPFIEAIFSDGKKE
ncbi:TIGR02444 family protein [Glycocaulis sp.]